jgi:DNA-binding response OmpR family regulator
VRERILVVDDEPQILRAVRTSLQAAGYEVDVAETAAAALTSAASRPPDAVILDLVLPDGNGIDVCRELRRWSAAPVLVLSAIGDEQEKVAALDAGAGDYVTKPFGVEELLARVRAALRRVDAPAQPVVDLGGLVVNLERRLRRREGQPRDAAEPRRRGGLAHRSTRRPRTHCGSSARRTAATSERSTSRRSTPIRGSSRAGSTSQTRSRCSRWWTARSGSTRRSCRRYGGSPAARPTSSRS